MYNSLISVIVTTRNEEKNIDNCLKSVIYQTYKNIEIIVVDNDSTDKTKEIAEKYTGLVYNKGYERSAQRNYGVNVAHGEWILYIDADMILSPCVVDSCIKEVEKDKSIVGLNIPEIIIGKSFWCKVRRFERNFYYGTLIDGFRFIKKSSFIEAKGFDETMSGPEDWDFDRKLSNIGKVRVLENPELYYNHSSDVMLEDNLKKWTDEFKLFLYERGIKHSSKCKNVLFHNESDFNLWRYLSKKNYYAKGFDVYINKWGENDPIIKKQFGISYRYFRVFVENGKWRRLIIHPILTFGMYLLRCMVGIIYLKNKINKKNL